MLVDILGRQLESNNLVVWDLNNNEKEPQGRYGLVISETKMYTLSKGFCNYDTTDCICYAITTPTSYEIQIFNLLRQRYSMRIKNSMNDFTSRNTEVHRNKLSSRVSSLINRDTLNPGDVFEANNGLQVIYLGKMKVYGADGCIVSGYAYLCVTSRWIYNKYFDLGYYLSCNACRLNTATSFYDTYISLLSRPISGREVINHVNVAGGEMYANLLDSNGRLGQFKIEIR